MAGFSNNKYQNKDSITIKDGDESGEQAYIDAREWADQQYETEW